MFPKILTPDDDTNTRLAKCQQGIQVVEKLVDQYRGKVPKAVLQSLFNWKLKYEDAIKRIDNTDQPLYCIREIFTGPAAEHVSWWFPYDWNEYDHPLRDIPLWKDIVVYRIPATPPETGYWSVLAPIGKDFDPIKVYERLYPNDYADRQYYVDDDYMYVHEKSNNVFYGGKFDNFYQIYEFPKVDIHDEYEIQLYIAQESLKRTQKVSDDRMGHKTWNAEKWGKRIAQWKKIIQILTQTKKPFTNISEVPDDLRDRFYDPFGHDAKIWLLNEWDDEYFEIMRDEKGKLWYKIQLLSEDNSYEDQLQIVENNFEHLEEMMKEASDYGRKDVYNILKRKHHFWVVIQKHLGYTPGKIVKSGLVPGCFEPIYKQYETSNLNWKKLHKLHVVYDDKDTQWKKAAYSMNYLEDLIQEAQSYLDEYQKAFEILKTTNQPIRVIPWDIQEIFKENKYCEYVRGKAK